MSKSDTVEEVARTIYTHRNPDIDSIMSIAALMFFRPEFADAHIQFENADWYDEDGDIVTEHDIILDMDANGQGIKGRVDADGTTHSCFAMVCERFGNKRDCAALESHIIVIDAHDAFGDHIGHLAPGLDVKTKRILTDTSMIGFYRSMKALMSNGDVGDLDMLAAFRVHLAGFVMNGRAWLDAPAVIESNKVIILPGGRVAITEEVKNHRVGEYLTTEMGVRIVIYVDGNNLGVKRRPFEPVRVTDESIMELARKVGELDEWFPHKAGWLFAWGTKKNPKDEKSKVDAYNLALAADKLILEYEAKQATPVAPAPASESEGDELEDEVDTEQSAKDGIKPVTAKEAVA